MVRSAHEIYSEVLDRLTGAIVSFDRDPIDRHMALPHLIVSLKAQRVMQTRDELYNVFTTYGHALRSLELSDYRRVAHECEFVSDTVIQGNHTNHFEKDGKDIIPTYPSMSTLELIDGDWRMTQVQSAIENTQWPMVFPEVGIEEPVNSFGPNQRLGILQDLLDRISDAFVNDDGETWADCVSLPFTMISRDGPDVFRTKAELFRDFRAYAFEIRSNGITDIVRKAISTQMVGKDMMVGTYRTYILRRTEQVVPSWQAAITLKRKNDQWRASTILRNIGHHNWSAVSAGDIENLSKSTPKSGDWK